MVETTDSIVEVADLAKVFRDFWHRPKVTAVDSLAFSVREGEVFGLLGPNGSGKSTTIKMMLGLLMPTVGSISVLGKSPRHVDTKRLIGYLPEESFLYKYLTPRETLEFYGRLFGMDRCTVKERTRQLLDMVGLSHAADRPVGEFSKGMTRRVGLAQALINDPQLIILDEPTSGLDPIGCRQVKDLILALAKRGKTVILSSHLLADVEDVCDKVAVLYNGKICAQGNVDGLLVKQEQMRLTVPTLPKSTMDKVLATLRETMGTDPIVDHPAMNLEQFFLQVVAEARQSANYDSGVADSKGLADFLSESRRLETQVTQDISDS